jgi:hypothetical protein
MLPGIGGPAYDADVAKAAQNAFEKQGLKFELGAKVTGVKKTAAGSALTAERDGQALEFPADKILVAVGREANATGLARRRKPASSSMNAAASSSTDTSRPTSLASTPSVVRRRRPDARPQGRGRRRRRRREPRRQAWPRGLPGVIPGVIYTDPEVACVGLPEAEAKAKNVEVAIGKFQLAGNGRAIASHCTSGFVKVIACAKTDQLLGVQMVAKGRTPRPPPPPAATTWNTAAATEDVARTCFAHPTVGEPSVQGSRDGRQQVRPSTRSERVRYYRTKGCEAGALSLFYDPTRTPTQLKGRRRSGKARGQACHGTPMNWLPLLRFPDLAGFAHRPPAACGLGLRIFLCPPSPFFSIPNLTPESFPLSRWPTIPKSSEPQAFEQQWCDRWVFRGLLPGQRSVATPRESFAVMIPPPDVTRRAPSMGHLLNNTLQDIMVRRAPSGGQVGPTGSRARTTPASRRSPASKRNSARRKARPVTTSVATRSCQVASGSRRERARRHHPRASSAELGASCDWDRHRAHPSTPATRRRSSRLFVTLSRTRLRLPPRLLYFVLS